MGNNNTTCTSELPNTGFSSDLSQYEFVKEIAGGGQGTVYLARDKVSGHKIAVKLESLIAGKGYALDKEYDAYMSMSQVTLVPRVFGLSRVIDQASCEYLAICMEDMGRSLHQVLEAEFPLPLTRLMQLGKKMLLAIRSVHEDGGMVHGDIKPSNFVFGKSWNYWTERDLYLIDFGCASQVVSGKDISHSKRLRTISGTLAFMSMNTHLGLRPSPRDDLMSFLYSLIYMANGCLPWSPVLAASPDVFHASRSILQMKQEIPLHFLCQGLPVEIFRLAYMIARLRIDQKPDYDEFFKLLQSCEK